MKRLKNFFITTLIGGLVIILPIAIFILIVNLFIRFVNNMLRPLANLLNATQVMSDIVVNLLAFAIVIAFCFMVGLFIRTRAGKNIWQYIEMTWLAKLPFYNGIKETVQQFSGAKKMPFKDVVLVDPFGNGTKMTGFITDEHDNGLVTVFVPTAPNPTNGFVFHLESHLIERVDTEPDEAIRSIIGIGVGSSEALNFNKKQLQKSK